jgi:hypothetical protein
MASIACAPGVHDARRERSIPNVLFDADVETHRKVFFWTLELLRDRGLLKGKSVGIDATTLEANAAMRSIVPRSGKCGESDMESI